MPSTLPVAQSRIVARLAAGDLTDATPTQLLDLLGFPVASVTNPEFGAVGDGITDDTAAIQAAIDSNQYVFAPEGTYLLGKILIPTGMRLFGAGVGLTEFKCVDKDSLALSQGWFDTKVFDTLTSARSTFDVLIQGITFNGINREFPRWLQNPSTGATITDPEADYTSGTETNKIGNTNYIEDDNSICLSQTPVGAGSLTINGAPPGASGIVVSGGSATIDPIRKVIITTVSDETARTFTITGTDNADAALVENITGANAGATFGSGLFKTITDVSVDAATAGAVEVGTKAFDIFGRLVLFPNRRDTDYISAGICMSLSKTERTRISDCKFINYNAMVIAEQGGKDVVIKDNHFELCGKNDSAFPCIWTQSFTTPGGGSPAYQDSENTQIRNNTARDIERSFALFAPTKGGAVSNNYVDGFGESCIFVGPHLHFTDGRSVIWGNTFKNGIITDIVSLGIEAANITDLDMHDNYFTDIDNGAISIPGSTRINVYDNSIKNVSEDTTIPYGPFSERYGFNVGQPPIAGDAIAVEDGAYIVVGTLTQGCDVINIHHNTIEETRASYPPVFKQFKSGDQNLSKNCLIESNQIDIPSGMTFFDTTATSVWDANISLRIKDNVGHVSEAPVVLNYQFPATTTGVVSFTPGFRPSAVHIIATNANPTNWQSWAGFWSWNSAATRNDTGLAFSVDSSVPDERAAIFDQDVIRLIDGNGGANTMIIELFNWQELGFRLNVITSASFAVNARFICYP